MRLYELLEKSDIAVKNNTSKLGNHLNSELAMSGKSIDFEKDVNDASEAELSEIGIILLCTENRGRPFFRDYALEHMKDLIKKYS